jgi:OmcA/MtrC family decaheme c-type cytochrome
MMLTACTGSNGINGTNGTSCTVAANAAGGKTISCTDGTTVTVPDGVGCTVKDNGDKTKTITCGTTTVVVADGSAGPGGECTLVTLYDGTENISCLDGTSYTIVKGGSLAWNAPLPGVKVTIVSATGGTGAGGNFLAGDTIKVTFKAEDATNTTIPIEFLDRVRVWFSGPTTSYQHIIPAAAKNTDIKTAAVDNKDGTYTYTFTTPIPAQVPPQLNALATPSFPAGSLAGQDLPDGTYTLSLWARRVFVVDGRTVADAGFDQASLLVGAASTKVDHPQLVKDDNCNACHRNIQGHGGSYRSTKLCVTCHTAGGEVKSGPAGSTTTVQQPIEFAVMIHKFHNGAHLPSALGIGVDASGNRTYGASGSVYFADIDISKIFFPVLPNFNIALPRDLGYSALSSANKSKEDALRKGTTNCSICHGGTTDGALAMTPVKRVCAACHDDVKFDQVYKHNGATMPIQSGETCSIACHNAGGAQDTVQAHTHPIDDPAVNKGVAFTLTAVGNTGTPAGNFKKGDKVIATFTLKNGAGTDIAPSAIDSVSAVLTGPNQNRNTITPIATATAIQVTPWDFAGRLFSVAATSSGSAAAAAGKGVMSKVTESATGTFVTETLKVLFTSPTAFTVSGQTSGTLGTGTFAGASVYAGANATSGTNASVPTAPISSVVLDPAVVAGPYQLAFTSATDFKVVYDPNGSPSQIGTGSLPASTASSVLFSSSTMSFIVTAGAYANSASTVVNFNVFKGGAGNPVLFAVVNGSLPYATGDRFYYDYLAPSAAVDHSYTLNVPMDIPWEALGWGTTVASQVFTAANVPVYYGRPTVYAVPAPTATGSVATLVNAFDRWAYLTDVSGLATNDFLVFEAGAGPAPGAAEEWLRVASVDATTRRVLFSTVFRFAHNPGASVKRAAAASAILMQEATDYTLVPATGVITAVNAIPSSTAWVMTYRTDAAFGWYRSRADVTGSKLQAVYGPALNTTGYLATPGQVWAGLPYIDGTYNLSLWGYANIYYGDQNEVQTYRSTSLSAQADLLYGAATTATPYSLISSGDNCNRCHHDLIWHGGSRRNANTCLTCHSTAGLEQNGGAGPAVFRSFAHEIHADTLPAMPNGSQHCDMCHGAGNATWKAPTDHTYPTATVAAQNYAPACSGCHDVLSPAGGAHIDAMISQFTQEEACKVCHGPATDLAPERMHPSR